MATNTPDPNDPHPWWKPRGSAVGAVVGVVSLLGLTCVLCCPFLPSPSENAHKRKTACLSNQRQLAEALSAYREDNGARLPPGETWCDAVNAPDKRPYLFLCPSRKCERSGYWMNALIAGTDTRPIANPDRLVVTFEGEDGWNRVGGPADQVTPHNGGANLGSVDGHAKWVGPKSQPPEWAPALPRPTDTPNAATGAARLSRREASTDE